MAWSVSGKFSCIRQVLSTASEYKIFMSSEVLNVELVDAIVLPGTTLVGMDKIEKTATKAME